MDRSRDWVIMATEGERGGMEGGGKGMRKRKEGRRRRKRKKN
jgi:hypothetical protein